MAQQGVFGAGAAKAPRMTLAARTSGLGYVLIAPVAICLLVLVVYPFLFAIYISFTNLTVGGQAEYIGFANYEYLFKQGAFGTTILNTTVLVGSVQTLKLVAGLGLAVLLNQAIRGRQFWRALVLLPWAMPAFVAYLTWKLLYAPQGGAFNMILLGLGLTDNLADFLGTRELAMPSVIAATFWRGFPFWVVSFLAAMQTISVELYEAAAMDGANAWDRFRFITLPGIRHTILIVLLLSTIWTANGFENVWLLTQGGPSVSTMTFPVFAYFGMQSMRLGEASAVSVAMLPVFVLMALFVVKLLERD